MLRLMSAMLFSNYCSLSRKHFENLNHSLPATMKAKAMKAKAMKTKAMKAKATKAKATKAKAMKRPAAVSIPRPTAPMG